MQTLHLPLKKVIVVLKNYRPVSVPSVMSKVFEKLLSKQLSVIADQNLSKLSVRLQKRFQCTIFLSSNAGEMKRYLDKKVFGALLTDRSRGFDYLSHELIIARLNAYVFSLPALKLIHDYLSNRQQRTKINHDFSLWEGVLFEVPQDSVLGRKKKYSRFWKSG